jgi:signal transduction histidine kinase
MKEESMIHNAINQKAFRLKPPGNSQLGGRWNGLIPDPLERTLGLRHLQEMYKRVESQVDKRGFCRHALSELNVRYHVSDENLGRIPKSASLIIVANHPFGAIEGLILTDIIQSVRPDIKVMSNRLLACISELHETSIFVDPVGPPASCSCNITPLKEALRWLNKGGVLGVFPAGEVSHLNLNKGPVADPAWSESIACLIRHTGSQVVPIFFLGTHSLILQLAGRLHPQLRTAMLPRPLLNRDHSISVRIGHPIGNRQLSRFKTDANLTRYLRFRTYMMAHPRDTPSRRPVVAISRPVTDAKVAFAEIQKGHDRLRMEMAERTAAEEARKESEARLQKIIGELESRLKERTAELAERDRALQEKIIERRQAEVRLIQTNLSLERTTAQLRRLGTKLAQVEEHERKRMAHVLHDQLQQMLVAASFGLSALEQGLSDEHLFGALRAAREALDEAIRESKSLVLELSPPILREGGVAQSLKWIRQQMLDKHGLSVHVSVAEEAKAIGEDLRVAIFRSVRELLFNTVKHSGVTAAEVELSILPSAQVRVVVSDLGQGFSPAGIDDAEPRDLGFGLFAIRERFESLGGHMEIDSRPGQGCRVTLISPIAAPSLSTQGPDDDALS